MSLEKKKILSLLGKFFPGLSSRLPQSCQWHVLVPIRDASWHNKQRNNHKRESTPAVVALCTHRFPLPLTRLLQESETNCVQSPAHLSKTFHFSCQSRVLVPKGALSSHDALYTYRLPQQPQTRFHTRCACPVTIARTWNKLPSPGHLSKNTHVSWKRNYTVGECLTMQTAKPTIVGKFPTTEEKSLKKWYILQQCHSLRATSQLLRDVPLVGWFLFCGWGLWLL